MSKYVNPIITGALLASFTLTQTALGEQSGSVYIFGDSGSSTGNYFIASGETQDPRYSVDGNIIRESNGPIWVEYIADFDLQNILEDETTSPNISYAFTGSVTGPLPELLTSQIDGFDSLPTGILQVDLFEQVTASSVDISKDDLFIYAISGNDYGLAGAAVEILGIEDREILEPLANELHANFASNTASATARLYDLGARTIAIESLVAGSFDPTDFSDDPLAAGTLYDTGRAAQLNALQGLAGQLNDNDLSIVMLPLHTFELYLRENAGELGFLNIDEVCIPAETNELCSTDPEIQNTYIRFDDAGHFTARANELQALYYGAFIDAAQGTSLREIGVLGEVAFELSSLNARNTRTRMANARQVNQSENVTPWIEIDYTKQSLSDGKQGSAGDLPVYSLAAGVDAEINENISVGAGLRYSSSKLKNVSRLRADTSVWTLSAQAEWTGTNTYAALIGDYSQIDVKNGRRDTSVPLLETTFDTDGKAWTTGLEAGFYSDSDLRWNFGVGIHRKATTLNGFTESAPYDLALSVKDQSVKATELSVSGAVRLASMDLSDSWTWTPHASATLIHDFDADRNVHARFVENAITNLDAAVEAKSVHGSGKLGLEFSKDGLGTVSFDYTPSSGRSGDFNHGVQIALRRPW